LPPFVGQAEATIDAKQRLAIPAKHRAKINTDRDGKVWYCVPWERERVLRLYSEAEFSRLSQTSIAQTLMPGAGASDAETDLFGFSEDVEMDSNGRVRIPSWQLELLGLPNEVVVIGVGNRLEVRSRDEWNRSRIERFRRMSQMVEQTDQARNAEG